MFNKTIVILACGALFAPMAFAQPGSTHNKQTTAATEQAITVTGTLLKMTTGEGTAANYQPSKTLVIREDRSNTPGSYVLNGRGNIVDKNGQVIQTAIKPGSHVRVYYVSTGDSRMIDHVVVD